MKTVSRQRPAATVSSATANHGSNARAARPAKRSFTIAGHRTSISLETAFWDALKIAADEDGLAVAAIVSQIDATRGAAGLSSAIRVWLLRRAHANSSDFAASVASRHS